MEVNWSVFLLIIGAAAVTFVPRVLPLIVLSRFTLPDWTLRWLSHIPIAVMAALVAQELIHVNGSFKWTDHLDLLAGVLTFVAAVKTKSLLWTVLFGIVFTFVLRLLA